MKLSASEALLGEASWHGGGRYHSADSVLVPEEWADLERMREGGREYGRDFLFYKLIGGWFCCFPFCLGLVLGF